MPNVDGKKFPYTEKGKADAKKAMKKNGSSYHNGNGCSDVNNNCCVGKLRMRIGLVPIYCPNRPV